MANYEVDQDFDVLVESENMDVEDVESSRIYLVRILVDASSSMYPYEQSGVMESALERLRDAVKNSKSADEMLLARTTFNSQVSRSGYQSADYFPTDYSTNGVTRLHDAIVDTKNDLYIGDGNGYMEKLKKDGTKVRGAVIVLSDGDDYMSDSPKSAAVEAIKLLKSKEIAVVFIAFGDEAKGIAEGLGIAKNDILETDSSESALRKAMDIVSKSAISASKSANAGDDDGFWQV